MSMRSGKSHPISLLTSQHWFRPWWRHQMETFSASLALCAGNSPVPGEFPSQRPVTRRFDIFFHLCLNKRLSKQSWGWWFETPSWSLWRHCNAMAWREATWTLYNGVTRGQCVNFITLSAISQSKLTCIRSWNCPPQWEFLNHRW